MMKKQIYKNTHYQINIIPLLDILLVLILVFIATSSAIQKIEINLPNIDHDTHTSIINNDTAVIIEVLKLSKYNLIINGIYHKNISYEQIIVKIKSIININNNTTFLVGGDKNLLYNEIVKTLNLLRQVGVRSIGLMTYPRN